MCGGCNGSSADAAAPNGTSNGASNTNGANGSTHRTASSPYQNVTDYLSNVNNFKIIESTLREGEQFANAFFDTETKVAMYARLPYHPHAKFSPSRDRPTVRPGR